VEVPKKIGRMWVYHTALFVFNLYFKFNGGLRQIGVENVPKEGGLIIAPNHLSNLDPPALACTLRHRRLLALGKAELFKNKIFAWIISSIGAFPLKRGEADVEAIKLCAELLKAGHPVIVFPEGTRGDGENLLPLSRGVAMLAKTTGLPVVPIGIAGTEAVMPSIKTRKKTRKLVTVVYGKPFTYADVATGASEKENRKLFMEFLEQQLLRLTAEGGLRLLPPHTSEEPKG
jgi:1-acyl-sn-glycerol-3-phosphate acyltransferase